ncbi:MAG: vitamin B12 dependent-methionine synthase activation domain-containing protein [Pseudomonadota bacterium]
MSDEFISKIPPPDFDSHVVASFGLNEIWHYLDRETLFSTRWQLRQNRSEEEWKKIVEDVAKPALDRVMELAIVNEIFQAEAVYAHFKCKRINNGLFIESKGKSTRFDFPRERKSPNRCVADFFDYGFITMMLVTIGNEVQPFAKNLLKENRYTDIFYLKGLAAETTEALAKYIHHEIRKKLNVNEDQGERFSFGYPAAPELSYQKKLVNFLDGKGIGISVTKTYHLVPEYSTSAIVSIDPNAKRFIP